MDTARKQDSAPTFAADESTVDPFDEMRELGRQIAALQAEVKRLSALRSRMLQSLSAHRRRKLGVREVADALHVSRFTAEEMLGRRAPSVRHRQVERPNQTLATQAE